MPKHNNSITKLNCFLSYSIIYSDAEFLLYKISIKNSIFCINVAKVILDFVNSNTEIWRHKIFAHSQNWKRDARLVSNDSTWPTEHFFFSKVFPKTSPLTCTGTQSLSFRHYFAKYWRKERLWASVQVKGNILVKSLLKKKCSVGQMLSFDTNLASLFQFWEWAKFHAFKSQW